VGAATPQAARPAEKVSGFVLTGACRFYEFEVRHLDASGERMHIEAQVVHAGRLRDFFGLNRAKHAVVEAAILATRLHLIPEEEIRRDFLKLRVLVEKTGGSAEHEAFEFLQKHIEGVYAGRAR
jgi:hypothetical protein